MSDKYFVDTNILVYAHDLTAGVKHQRARALIEKLWNSGLGVLSTQVIQELCVSLRRKAGKPLGTGDVRKLIQDYLAWDVVVNDPTSALEALDIELQYKISFWDALIVYAAEKGGAKILYSEDLADGQRYGSVQVVNPLKDPTLPKII